MAPVGLYMDQYGGDFYSDEVENTINIQMSEDGSGILFPMFDDMVWVLSAEDEFKHPEGAMFLNFARDVDGNIVNFTYNGTRVMGVTFKK